MVDQATDKVDPSLGEPAQEVGEKPSSSGSSNAGKPGEGLLGFDRIQQLKVRVQAVLGATPLSISELASLEKGDVIKLDTKIGDPISILANGDEIARAEIVVTQDQPPKFGLTLTEIIDTKGPQGE